MSPTPIRVLLVDDHTVVRQGIRLMLEETTDIVVAGEAACAREALERVTSDDYDVAIVDVNLPDRNGLDLLAAIKDKHPRLPVLVFSMYREEAYAVRALQLGAAGYVTKEVAAGVLQEAIRKAAAGGKYITPGVAEKLALAVGRDGGRDVAPHERLSEREFEVLRYIVAGRSLVDAANEMHLSPKTVTAYRTRILEKTGFKSNAELVRYAFERHLFE